jgi:hypothetical protein
MTDENAAPSAGGAICDRYAVFMACSVSGIVPREDPDFTLLGLLLSSV